MNKKAKRISIPLDVWEAKDLGWKAKFLYAEIARYAARGKDCVLTNQQIAGLLGVSYRQACNIISDLIFGGYIVAISFDGRCRKLQCRLEENCKADLQKTSMQTCNKFQPPIPISIVSSDIDISSDTSYTSTSSDKSSEDRCIKDIKKKLDKEKKFDFRGALRQIGVSKDAADDWLAVRKTKRATNTKIAFDSVACEIAKSGHSADECIRFAVTMSWAGFRWAWMKNELEKQTVTPAAPVRENYVQAGLRVADELLGTNYTEQLNQMQNGKL